MPEVIPTGCRGHMPAKVAETCLSPNKLRC